VDVERRALERREICDWLKTLIVERLDLPIPPGWITDDQPLFGRGLELDSVDVLELVVAIEYEFDVTIDDEEVGVFGSVNSAIDYIEAKLHAAS
jgi:acyl carrier protein